MDSTYVSLLAIIISVASLYLSYLNRRNNQWPK